MKKPVEMFGQFGTVDYSIKDRKEFMRLCGEAFELARKDFLTFFKDFS